MNIIPPYLTKGDLIGITCPAGYMPREKATTCIKTLQRWGFDVMAGNTLGSSSPNYFSGTDEERLDELQAMLDAPEVKAILCGRGGYGMGRIIDRLDFRMFRKHPKWIIGFSDITVLHCHLNTKLHIASLHAPMAAAFNDGTNGNPYVLSVHKALTGKKAAYSCKGHAYNRNGSAAGELVGGNLALISHLCGTPSGLRTKGKILFLEDTGEYLYNLDRMLWQLKRSGILKNLSGLILGGFTDMKDTERPFGQDAYAIISSLTREYNYPVCFGFPAGHQRENYALKSGAVFRLEVTRQRSVLREL